MTTLTTACPLDCPDACSVSVTVEQGRVTRLDASSANPLTQGFICSKVRRFADHVYAPERLEHPAVRDGEKGTGQFRSVSWDEALKLLSERIDAVRGEHGGEAILPVSYGGSNGWLTQDTSDADLFRDLGASRLARTVCAAPSGRAATGLYGRMPGVALTDYEHARLIIIWGSNPSVSGIHLVPVIKDARSRGAQLVVIDPRCTPLAKQADLHLPVRPGTDLVVALSLIRWLFESGRADRAFLEQHATGADELRRRARPWSFDLAARLAQVESSDLERLAEMYAESSPAVIRCGWGLERNRNGGSAVAAVLALPAVAGKFGVRGGGYTMSNVGAWEAAPEASAVEDEPQTREINMNQLGQALLELEDPPIKFLFVYNCNPLATLPDQEKVRQGLEREDLFTVVFEQVQTDTARYADVLLPATTFLEHHDLARGYGAMVLQTVRPVIDPVGEARPNYAVFSDLCQRLGVSGSHASGVVDAMTREALVKTPNGEDIGRSLANDGIAFPSSGFAPVQFQDVFPRTADRRVHLVPEELDREAPDGLYGYRPDPGTLPFPLTLISPATGRTISSTLGELNREPAMLEMHPRDAAARGLRDRTEVRIFNRLGEVRSTLRLSEDVRPGVVCLPKGLWSHNTKTGTTANALVPGNLADLGGGACFNDARVQVEKVVDSS